MGNFEGGGPYNQHFFLGNLVKRCISFAIFSKILVKRCPSFEVIVKETPIFKN